MGRSILAIAQEAARRENTAPAPSVLFGASTKIALVLQTAAHDTMREYLRRSGQDGLSEFHSTWVFALQPGRFAYELPPDFLRMIPDTEHIGGSPIGVVGPASPQCWAEWIFGGATSSPGRGWRIRNNAIWIDPVPAAWELVTIEYVSRYPVVGPLLQTDYDATLNPPRFISPFVPRDGYIALPTNADLDITEAEDDQAVYDLLPGWDVGTFGQEAYERLRRIALTSVRLPLPEVRRPYFTTDADKPAFDDDYLLSLGMTFRLRRALGLDYAEAAAEYEQEMDQRLAHDAGLGSAIRLGGAGLDIDTYPAGNGRWVVT